MSFEGSICKKQLSGQTLLWGKVAKSKDSPFPVLDSVRKQYPDYF